MTSPTGSVSDLLAAGGLGTGGLGGSNIRNNDTLDASTFIDPFSESNPFADDIDSISGPPGLASVGGAGVLKGSQSLNFHEYYPQSTIAAETDDDDSEATGHGGGGGTEGSLYGVNTTFQKSFSAMNLAGQQQGENTLSPSPYYGAGAAASGGFEDYQPRSSHQYDSDGGVQRYATGGGGGGGGHQRWSSVDSDHHDDVEEVQQGHGQGQGQRQGQGQGQRQGQGHGQEYDQVSIVRGEAGQFRPESTRSLGSQVHVIH